MAEPQQLEMLGARTRIQAVIEREDFMTLDGRLSHRAAGVIERRRLEVTIRLRESGADVVTLKEEWLRAMWPAAEESAEGPVDALYLRIVGFGW